VAALDEEHLEAFGRDGYLVLRGGADEARCSAADAEVDELIEGEPPTVDGAGQDATFWFEPVARLPRCHDLLRATPVAGAAAELVAPLSIAPAFDHIQVAITVPPWSHRPGAPHVDGYSAETAASTEVAPASFTMLCGVALTDQRGPQRGNLWVWPGSHLDHARLFQEQGVDALRPTYGHAALLRPPLAYSQAPVELELGRGDVVLAHHLLGHNKGGNEGIEVRRTIYLRLRADGHADRWADTFLDPLTEYAPVRAALGY
jgi:ectoine hydroxylase-related dioxygenase (phytanoyl-CoA dioxygenase family)